MIKRVSSRESRVHRHKRIRVNLAGTPERPRISIFRSSSQIYAQIIDDVAGNTLVHASSRDKDLPSVEPVALPAAAPAAEKAEAKAPVAEPEPEKPAKGGKGGAKAAPKPAPKAAKTPGQGPAGAKVREAQQVGALLAKRALDKGIKKVVFDRSGYPYHGRIKALADAARASGLEF